MGKDDLTFMKITHRVVPYILTSKSYYWLLANNNGLGNLAITKESLDDIGDTIRERLIDEL